MFKLGCAVFLFAVSVFAQAAGPQDVAKADFSLWPRPIASRADFDTASRAELLVAALAFEKALLKLAPADLGVKQIQADSLRRWVEAAKREWLAAFRSASMTCQPQALACGFQGSDWSGLTVFALRFVAGTASEYAAWLQNSQAFYAAYLREQLRLAALFPHPTSEILTLAESEITGNELPDGQFVLSLDDGPTAVGGDSERYAKLLAEANISAVFFALGNALENRIQASSVPAVKNLYAGHCLGSHGYEHKPHAAWPAWQASLEKTQNLIRQVFPEQKKILFRPPYGQRHAELLHFVEGQGGKLVLWNIDSQDWHGKIAKDEVAARVKKLMLFKRHGIILFHDVHDKGLVALPEIVRFAAKAGLSWEDCHAL